MTDRRFTVVDDSVIVSATLVPSSIPGQARQAARRSTRIALSTRVFNEIAGVLARTKFAAVLTAKSTGEILLLLNAAAAWFEPTTTTSDCIDPKHNNLERALAAAEAGPASIVSGEDDLRYFIRPSFSCNKEP